MANVCRSMNAVDVRVAKDEAEADALRATRRSALSALARLKPTTILEDATVPRSQIAPMVEAINAIAKNIIFLFVRLGMLAMATYTQLV